jgi:hypothetical protein
MSRRRRRHGCGADGVGCPSPPAPLERRGKESTMIALSLRYARYAVSILGTVGFGVHIN